MRLDTPDELGAMCWEAETAIRDCTTRELRDRILRWWDVYLEWPLEWAIEESVGDAVIDGSE